MVKIIEATPTKRSLEARIYDAARFIVLLDGLAGTKAQVLALIFKQARPEVLLRMASDRGQNF